MYSHVHFAEINQISKQEYIEEHISLLSELGAIYVKPVTNQLDTRNAHIIWKEYLENEKENLESYNGNPEEAIDKIARKLSGLPINNTFSELNDLNRDIAISLIESVEREFRDLDQETLKSLGTEKIDQYKALFRELREKANESNPLDIPEDKPLGPDIFRGWLKKQGISFDEIEPREVIPTIVNALVSENKSSPLLQLPDGGIQSLITQCYHLMNWAGYHSDDFTSQKKGKDRFRASSNDSSHACEAIACNFIISSDDKFIKKIQACYAFLELPPLIHTPEEFEQQAPI